MPLHRRGAEDAEKTRRRRKRGRRGEAEEGIRRDEDQFPLTPCPPVSLSLFSSAIPPHPPVSLSLFPSAIPPHPPVSLSLFPSAVKRSFAKRHSVIQVSPSHLSTPR